MGKATPVGVRATRVGERGRGWSSVVIAAALCHALVAGTAKAVPVQFVIDVQDAPGVGFNDPTFGADALNALQTAADIWGSLLHSNYAGETITFGAGFTDLGGTAAGNTPSVRVEYDAALLNPFFYYPGSLGNHVAGMDLSPGINEFDLEFDLPRNWYFGTDAMPGVGQNDFLSTALHEIGHGLGFRSGLQENGFLPFPVPEPPAQPNFFTGYIYDTFVSLSATPMANDDFPIGMTVADRIAALVSDNLFWVGSNGTAGNGGVAPKLNAPNPFVTGSSVIHLDPAVFGQTDVVMGTSLSAGMANHTPSSVDLGMLKDMGWNIAGAKAIPEPVSMGLCLTALTAAGCSAGRRRV